MKEGNKTRGKHDRNLLHSMEKFIKNVLCNLVLAILAVYPMICYLCEKIPFTYEVNDDAMLAQILDGSYTGMPNAHSIFVRYPLSWLISKLYSYELPDRLFGISMEHANWYIATILLLETLAMILVLYRLLTFFSCNRILLCFAFDTAFMIAWMTCFFRITFSTAGAFFGCMTILYLAFETKEQAYLPWNIVILFFLMVCTYCMRNQCFYMIAPFLIGEFIYKYNRKLFVSIKPWILFLCLGIGIFGVMKYNDVQYSSKNWQNYLSYNHARAYMQDYVGFPDEEEDPEAAELYEKLGISIPEKNAMKGYTYCLVDDFKPAWMQKIYRYTQSKEEKLSLTSLESLGQLYIDYQEKALRYFFVRKMAPKGLRFLSLYLLFLSLPVFLVNVVFRWEQGKKSILSHLWDLLTIAGFWAVLSFEWFYLAMNGRFPRRVEETIRITTLAVGVLLVAHLFVRWKDLRFFRLTAPLQVGILLLALFFIDPSSRVKELKSAQDYRLNYVSDKSEMMAYCGQHKENFYILDTLSFTKMSKPLDDTSQGNWIMSANWAAFSPLYYEKLHAIGTDRLGDEFVLRDNVYIITKGKKSIRNMLGKSASDIVETEIADEITASSNNIYEVYKVIRLEERPDQDK